MGIQDRDYHKEWVKQRESDELRQRLQRLKVQPRQYGIWTILGFWIGVMLLLWAAFKFYKGHH